MDGTLPCWPCQQGVVCRREARAIEAVGCYVPGGTAVLPSTALMLAVVGAGFLELSSQCCACCFTHQCNFVGECN